MKFNRWLKEQNYRDDRVGDLANDVIVDLNWPKRATKLKSFQRYLDKAGACDGALLALEQAWSEYAHEIQNADDYNLLVECDICNQSTKKLYDPTDYWSIDEMPLHILTQYALSPMLMCARCLWKNGKEIKSSILEEQV